MSEGVPKTSNPAFKVMLVLGLVLILAAVIIAAFLVWRYVSANQQYVGYREIAGLELTDVVAADVDPDAVNIDWTTLKVQCPDVVGWIMIPGTSINYPIVQSSDNDYYLTRLADQSSSASGAIFLDYASDPKLQGKNNMVYGHNMLDGSMFAGLKDYRGAEFYDAHKTILLFTPEASLKLEVAAIITCNADDKIRQVSFVDDADYIAYVSLLLGYASRSEIDISNAPDKLYCFATCTELSNSQRFLVLAKVVSDA